MASLAFEGNYKVFRLDTEPAGFDPEAGSTISLATDLGGSETKLDRLVSNGAFEFTYNQNTASQALVDLGKISHNLGTREVTGLSITHEADFPLETDAMWGLYNYGDKVWYVVVPDKPGGVADLTAGDIVHVFECETGEAQVMATAQDTKQNFMVGHAVQDWDFNAVVAA